MDSGKDKCQAIQSWTFSGLVGAFLDLAIAYLLLCGSALAYLASKFLGFFGLHLPCPCNGLFWNPKANKCLQKVLVESPSQCISGIHLSVKNKLPYGSMWTEDQNCLVNMKLIRHQSQEIVHDELEGESSFSSVTERKENGSVGKNSVQKNEIDVEFHLRNFPALTEGRIDSKGKGVTSQRVRPALRRRHRKAADCGKFSSVTSYDLWQLDVPDVSQPPFSLNKTGSEKTEGSSEPVFSLEGSEAPKDIGLQEKSLGDSELSETVDEDKSAYKDAFTSEGFVPNEQDDLGMDRYDKNMIRVLEQALGEEHAVRAALYTELEKERIAASTAADEAMNMILRLQEEKAAVEMEARQYQRILEAKATYDAEEMNILKEILLRREREKHFLEKEVEAYRQIFFGNEQLDADTFDFLAMQGERASLYPDEDPVLMLQGISDSIDEKDKMKNAAELKSSSFSTYEAALTESKDHTLLSGDKLQTLGLDEVIGSSRSSDIHRQESISPTSDIRICDDLEFQEKGMVFMEENPSTQQRDMQSLETRLESVCKPDLLKKTIVPLGKEEEKCNYASVLDRGGIDLLSLMSNKEPGVHFIKNGSMSNDMSGKKGEQLSVDDSLYTVTDFESPPMRRLSFESDRSRSSSELTSGLPPLGPSRGKASISRRRRRSMSALELNSYNEPGCLREPRNDNLRLRRFGCEKGTNQTGTYLTSGLPPLGPSRGKLSSPDLRRRSLSALDNERLKLETEVRWLREKLKMVQKGREKLSITVERTDREKVQFQLLDDIASQLREIRQLTEPGKAAAREAIMPPPSKVKSKKRRCRSASIEVPGSS